MLPLCSGCNHFLNLLATLILSILKTLMSSPVFAFTCTKLWGKRWEGSLLVLNLKRHTALWFDGGSTHARRVFGMAFCAVLSTAVKEILFSDFTIELLDLSIFPSRAVIKGSVCLGIASIIPVAVKRIKGRAKVKPSSLCQSYNKPSEDLRALNCNALAQSFLGLQAYRHDMRSVRLPITT